MKSQESAKMESKGRLVVIDGPDGCGKETQIQLLKTKFPDAALFKYPSKYFELLRNYLEMKIELEPKALFLLFLADIAEGQKKVRKALSERELVILDRYVFSTISYEVKGISYEKGKSLVENIGYLKPYMVILLDIDAKTSQERKAKQKELDRYEGDMEYLEKVRSNYLKLYEEKFLTENWHMIDARKSIGSVHDEIIKLFR